MGPLLRRRLSLILEKKKLLRQSDHLIIGVSGGPDSMALLHLLAAVHPPDQLTTVTIDHGLRPDETPQEIKQVKNLCNTLAVEHQTCCVDVNGLRRKQKCSLEAAARELRHQQLEEICLQKGAAAIALAHTANDQAEEVLIRLLRGSGRKGLSGMNYRQGRIIRPLLGECKEELIHYLLEEGIPWSQDSSNLDQNLLRNRVRLDLLPRLRTDYNPGIDQTLIQTAAILNDEEDILEQMAQTAYEAQVGCSTTSEEEIAGPITPLTLNLQPFLASPPALQRRVLEKVCWQMQARPQFRQIEQLRELAMRPEPHGQAHLTSGLRVHKQGSTLLFHYPSGKHPYRGN
ncbi:MAG: tRNA lysidine(34) synthetase TilS [Desulfobulbaceae bacterium]|uniref:tRNA(Ile)-lysidine synthase n=1 Tax=Candidatus Desulfatifera sulfidica TaxID=2841691 RepID=A0A8J6N8F2_9BACT|nr:tRNA lysidine(34) synthetase TilS [Candidatus Desulfatifera sulfidica]